MGCSSCGERARKAKQKKQEQVQFVPTTEKTLKGDTPLPIVDKSESETKVKLRYLGGGYSANGQGCRSCGGSGTKYKFVTSERIQFVSEDVSDGWFNQLFTVGHNYFVTEKQAEYLLSLQYTSKAGRVVNKFERVD